ncbi:helix-turn-helix transcriptional regulator [Rhodococcus sp. NPDC079359]|uniref:PadR family transcriptional regulator n=1 Tax=Rhodococcus sp. NPDC079359 TaxID=3154961 RepID=UPI00344B1A23
MPQDRVRITPNVQTVLSVFLDDLAEPQYGYSLMEQTDFSSGKIYTILARLESAGWLRRTEHDSRVSGGPPRVTYTVPPEVAPTVRRALAEASERQRTGNPLRVHLPRLTLPLLR